jgi:hypothetical protein
VKSSTVLTKVLLARALGDRPPLLLPETARGCWWGEKHHCTFCGLNGATMAFRKKSPDRVLSELVELSGKHRLLRFQTVDNIIAMSYFRDVLPRIGELDLVLSHLKESGVGVDIGIATVQEVAKVHRIQSELDVGIEEFVALWSLLPRQAVMLSEPRGSSTGETDETTTFPPLPSPLARLKIPLFDRRFRQSGFSAFDLSAPPNFLHPALATVTPANVDPELHRLLAGTGADEDQLYQLIVGLARPLGIDLGSADDNQKKFALNHRNISLLYRHAQLARLLKLSIPELFALCGLTPAIGMSHIEGLSDLVGTIKRVRANINPRLQIAGLLRTMYDPRNTLSHQVSQQLEEHFGDKVYRTLVPRNVRLAEAPSFGAPAVVWDRSSKGAQAYIALADEILARAGVSDGNAA